MSIISSYSQTKTVISPYHQIILEIYVSFISHFNPEPYPNCCEEWNCQLGATQMVQEIKKWRSTLFRRNWKNYRVHFCNFPFLIPKQSHRYMCTQSYNGEE